jgi:hypothetical protein
MKRTFYAFFILTAIVILGTSGIKSVQNSGIPNLGNTGATGQYCNSCHSGANNFNAAGGGITVNGLPGGYTLNTVYTFSITINHATANRKRWGFAIKAVNASGAVIGTFTTTNPNASAGSGELRHSNAPISASGANTYTYANLKWAAPLTNNLADKTVKFFLVAVAADGSGGTNADFVYSKLVTIPPATVIKSFTPFKGATGTSVTIKGTSFSGGTDVSFGGVIAQSFVVNNDTTVTAVVGAGSSGSVSVTSPAGTASLAGFTYCAVTPTSTNVNLSGCNSLAFNDSTYFTSAVVRDTIRTVNGCDSIYKKTNITIKSISPTSQSSNQSACDKFIYKNITYNSSTVIKDTLRTQEGCDSIFLTINATVNPSVNGRIYHPLKGNISNIKITQSGTVANTYTASGNYAAPCINATSNIILRPIKNNDITKANGINATDILFIQRHILGSPKLNSTYKIIAADVNGDKVVNATDVLRIKRLILGTDTTFTKGTGANKVDRLWEFVDSAYQFPDTTNPFPFKDSISFTNLISNKINQTFIGIKLGDVNYDWNPAVARGLEAKPVEFVYTVRNEELGIGNSVVRIPITANNFKELVAMQYTLHFNNKDYEFVGIENNKLDIDFNSKQATNNGNISFLWTGKNAVERSLEDGTELYVLVLKQKGTGNLELGISDAITEIAAWDKDYNQHTIILAKREIITNNSPLTTSQWSVSPNPTSGEIKVSIVSKTNKTVSFELTDAQGKAIFKQVVELQKGNNNFTMNLKKNGNITTGIYFLKAVGIEGEIVKRIMVK